MMERQRREKVAEQLQGWRNRLFAEASWESDRSAELRAEPESEIEERAQEEHEARVLDRLDLRARHEIEEIDAALRRLADGTFGVCAECEEPISAERLVALPTAALCVDCARAGERAAAARGVPAGPESTTRSAPLPEDISRLSDDEASELVNERLRNDDRIDSDDLRAECRGGRVVLRGALPSTAELTMARKIVSDVLGFHEVDDEVKIERQAWERRSRTPDPVPRESAERQGADLQRMGEPVETGDVVESDEEGIGFAPSDRPLRDQQK